MAGALAFSSLMTFAQQPNTAWESLPVPSTPWVEMVYAPAMTTFQLWAPTAEQVRLRLYKTGHEGKAWKTLKLEKGADGTWSKPVKGDLKGKFYTFEVKVDGKWRGETPGINARAVGVNGQRAAVIDLKDTNPAGWEKDKATYRLFESGAIYEMHHRDFSMSDQANFKHRGKFLALTEKGVKTLQGSPAGLEHLKRLGVSYVHILPSFDYASVDETKLDVPQYNWGYDPLNYNVPEGSYSTDPYQPEVRIREFKQMVQVLHEAGLKVVLDVVYNHTFNTDGSNFERTVPGYFFRHKADGSLCDASGCGNETASERAMMRKFMVESVEYWMREYHIDGFRFDLMGIHDIETMRSIRKAAERINPKVLIYGEGWAAGTPALPAGDEAMKAEVHRMPGIAAFSDELRDALRGPFSNDKQPAMLAGLLGNKESVKMGIVGGIPHPQVDYSKVNYSKSPWAEQPHQLITYVSCHDDMCLNDRIKNSIPNLCEEELVRLNLLAQTLVFTSQGVPFIQAGEELFRDKKMVHNSFKSPDSINTIDWSRRDSHKEVYEYYRALMQLRSADLAFSLGDAQKVREYVSFLPSSETSVVFRINGKSLYERHELDYVVAVNLGDQPETVMLPSSDYLLVMGLGVDARCNVVDSNVIQRSDNGEAVPQRFVIPAKSAAVLRPYSIVRYDPSL